MEAGQEIAGQSSAQWVESGICMAPPTTSPGVTAANAERIALLGRHSGATKVEVTLVHMEMRASRVVPSGNYCSYSVARNSLAGRPCSSSSAPTPPYPSGGVSGRRDGQTRANPDVDLAAQQTPIRRVRRVVEPSFDETPSAPV